MKIKSKAIRRREIAASQKIKAKKTYDFEGPTDETLTVDVRELDLYTPIFRLQNGRTDTQQDTYSAIHRDDVGDAFFEDNESEEAQVVQKEILMTIINNSSTGGEFLNDLKEKGLKAPLLITADGVVLNGNRRLAAMRHLKEEEAVGRFDMVKVAYCPANWNESQFIKVEEKLQIAEEFKEQYDWENEARLFKNGYKDISPLPNANALCKSRWGKDEKEIKKIIGRLGEAELYLESRNQKGRYDLIHQHSQIWDVLHSKLFTKRGNNKDLNGEQRNAGRAIVYTHIDLYGSKKYSPTGDQYTRVNKLLSNLPETLARFAAYHSFAPEKKKRGALSGRDSKVANLTEYKKHSPKVFDSSAKKCEEADKVMTEILEIVKEEQKEDAPRKYVQDAEGKIDVAITRLANLNGQELDVAAITKAIKTLEKSLKRLKTKLKTFR